MRQLGEPMRVHSAPCAASPGLVAEPRFVVPGFAVPPDKEQRPVVLRKHVSEIESDQVVLHLRLPGGNSGSVTVRESCTGRDLKRVIQRDHGIRGSHMALMFYGRRLDDDVTMLEAGVASGAPIEVGLVPPSALKAPPGLRSHSLPNAEAKYDKTPLSNRVTLALDDCVQRSAAEVDSDPDTAEALEFLEDISMKDASAAPLIEQVQKISLVQFGEDSMRMTKNSGFRLTILAGRGRRVKEVVAYTMYRYVKRTIEVAQIGTIGDEPDAGLEWKMAKWLIRAAKQAAMENIMYICRPVSVQVFQGLGFNICNVERAELRDDEVCMEYRCTRTKRCSRGDLQSSRNAVSAAPRSGDGSSRGSRGDDLSLENVNRKHLVSRLFSLCDVDGDGHLNEREALTFANLAGFDGTLSDWKSEYALLCTEQGINPSFGLTQEKLAELVDDVSEKGSFCTDGELREMIRKFEEMAEETSLTRTRLVREVFVACDMDGDGFLSVNELKRFAVHTGFSGDDAAWATEYNSLCSEFGLPQGSLIDLKAFEALVNDSSETGCYCNDADLRSLLQFISDDRRGSIDYANDRRGSLRSLRSAGHYQECRLGGCAMARQELVRAVFQALDTNHDGILGCREMKVFARQTGFEGTAQEWLTEYESLCVENRVSPAVGIDESVFSSLVNQASSKACYCTDEELSEILLALPVVTSGQVVQRKDSETEDRMCLLDTIFLLLDGNRDGVLSVDEMEDFARFTGFDGTTEAWAEEYAKLFAGTSSKPKDGFTKEAFARLVNDESADGQFCSDDELRQLLVSLENRPVASSALNERRKLVHDLFCVLDTDEDGLLRIHDLERFAHTAGCAKGLLAVFRSWGKNIPNSCDEVLFSQVVNHETLRKMETSDVHLRLMTRALSYSAPASPVVALRSNGSRHSSNPNRGTGTPDNREKLVADVFKACCAEGCSRLRREDMEQFGRLTGFEGTSADWGQEYESLCNDRRVDPALGFDCSQFASLVNDSSETGQYCSYDELRVVLGKLAPERNASDVRSVASEGMLAPSGKQLQQERAKLVLDLFKALDMERTGYLRRREMEAFARGTGFGGSSEEWSVEYNSLCTERSVDPRIGFDHFAFGRLVDDDSDAGQFCSNAELTALLKAFKDERRHSGVPLRQRASTSIASTSQPPPLQQAVASDAPAKSPVREGLARAVFEACDADCDGYLNAMEMRVFADFTGFSGGLDEWEVEFKAVCREKGLDKSRGVTLEAFLRLVDDNSDDGCYCSDDELAAMVRELKKAQPLSVVANHDELPPRQPPQMLHANEVSRAELIASVFRALDRDVDGRLNVQEMERFAQHIGFDGSDAEWALEYKILQEEKGEVLDGIDLARFEALANDTSERGCFCDDEELRSLLSLLRGEAAAPKS